MQTSPLVLGIAGGVASGKSTIAQGVARILGEDRVSVINTDDYRRPGLDRAEGGDVPGPNPDDHYIDILEQHLTLLRRGQAVLTPVIQGDGAGHGGTRYLPARQFVIVDGPLAYCSKGLRGLCDVRVFLEPQEGLRSRWLGAHPRGPAIGQARGAADPIGSQRHWADTVLRFYSTQAEGQGSTQPDLAMILRPTLPMPELHALLKEGAPSGDVRLELDRDMGLPVDRLEIRGGVPQARAAQLQAHLWESLPPQLRRPEGALGVFDSAQEAGQRSHALAVAQLLVAQCWIRAVRGYS